MKILVTGGAGFIGSHVVRAFLTLGHEVVVIDDLSSGKRANLPPEARLEVMDICSPQAAELVRKERFEVIDHHAAQISVPFSVQNPLADAATNVLGLINLVEAGRHSGLRRVVFISSGGAIYGEVPRVAATEDTPTKPLSPYAVSKITGEKYLAYYSLAHGIEVVALRYGNVYGPRQIPHGEAGVVAIFMDQILANKKASIFRYDDTPGGMIRDYVYAGDCAAANALALDGKPGAYNIATGRPTDTLSLWQAVAKAADSDPGHEFGPARPGDLRRSLLDCSKAERGLSWRPEHDLASGIHKTWQWRVGEGYRP